MISLKSICCIFSKTQSRSVTQQLSFVYCTIEQYTDRRIQQYSTQYAVLKTLSLDLVFFNQNYS